MKRIPQILLIISILLIMLLITSCDNSNYSKAKGQVLDRITGNPIEGAQVAIKNTETKTDTDEDGSYSLGGIVPGSQSLVITKDGYCSYETPALTFARGLITKAQDIVLLQKPPSDGLFEYDTTDNVLKPVSYNSNESTYRENGTLKTYDSNVRLVFRYTRPTKAQSIRIYNAEFKEAGFFTSSHWSLVDRIVGGSIEAFPGNVVLVEIKLEPGMYGIFNVNDQNHFYFFKVVSTD